jgi:hypothetical protein
MLMRENGPWTLPGLGCVRLAWWCRPGKKVPSEGEEEEDYVLLVIMIQQHLSVMIWVQL